MLAAVRAEIHAPLENAWMAYAEPPEKQCRLLAVTVIIVMHTILMQAGITIAAKQVRLSIIRLHMGSAGILKPACQNAKRHGIPTVLM